jgi:hypothetical protein
MSIITKQLFGPKNGSNICRYFELKEALIDLNSSDTQHLPKARFILTSDIHNDCSLERINVVYRALIDNKINIIENRLCVRVDNGYFEFIIPRLTNALEVIVNINTGNCCTKLKEYYPTVCKTKFSATKITTRLTMEYCNKMAVDTSGLDHTPVKSDETRIFGHQLGPCRAARAMAIIHIAMFEALNAVVGGYKSYLDHPPKAPPGTSADVAICKAVHDTLVALFPSHYPRLDVLSNDLMIQCPDGPGKTRGLEVGAAIAKTILAMRANDGSDHPEPIIGLDYIANNIPGEWTMDPISKVPKAIGARWSEVTPFVIPAANTYRCPPPPGLDTDEYMMAYDEVKALGGDGAVTQTTRSQDQTEIGLYWAYDGTPSLCAPPRLYNQIVMQVANEQGLDTIQMCRLLALVNVAMADAAIAAWESKYYYKFWRPITAIRNASMDCNPNTVQSISWTPLGAPLSNGNGPNFTPPFPSYPSGHSTFQPTVAQILRHILGTDNILFTFVSDEYNGLTKDNQGNTRPLQPRTFSSLTQTENENGDSRVYLGIHFKFDKTAGITLGHAVADDVIAHLYKPL